MSRPTFLGGGAERMDGRGGHPDDRRQRRVSIARKPTYVWRILLFLLYSYVNSYLDNDIWIPIYKTIPAICNTPRQTQCVPNSIFPHFIMVISDYDVLWGAELWFVVCGCVLVR